jgi:hypothetical protein
MSMKGRLVTIGIVIIFCAPASAQDANPDRKADPIAEARALSKRIDRAVFLHASRANFKLAGPADEAVAARRLHLDLLGRIPTLLEMRDYLTDDRDDRRALWVERMLASERYAEHFANVWRDVFLPTRMNVDGVVIADNNFEMWLEDQLKDGTGYDKIARGLLLANQQAARRGSAAAFFTINNNKPEEIAGAAARALLGVRLECAQCHHHPFAKWKREQFWELAAFFSAGPGQVARVDVQIPGTEKRVKAAFLDGTAPPANAQGTGPQVLADWIVTRENPWFARAAVDHVWSHFFGVSLLEGAESKEGAGSLHRELLDLLAKDFADHDFDLKHLIRAIVYSETYQRASTAAKDNPEEIAFLARMPVRSLSAEQLYDSFTVATKTKLGPRDPNNPYSNPNAQPMSERAQFLAKFSDPGSRIDGQTSILQALFLMNGAFLAERIDPAKNEALRILATQPTSHERRIESLYLMVLGRPPRAEEQKRLVAYVERGGPTRDRAQAISDIYWALLNSSEFMLNH